MQALNVSVFVLLASLLHGLKPRIRDKLDREFTSAPLALELGQVRTG
jgi:hypothetical protein